MLTSNTQRTCEMALEAHNLYKQIAFEENIQFDKVEKGILHIYTDEAEYENAKRVNEVYAKAGLKRWEVSADECVKIELQFCASPPNSLAACITRQTLLVTYINFVWNF